MTKAVGPPHPARAVQTPKHRSARRARRLSALLLGGLTACSHEAPSVDAGAADRERPRSAEPDPRCLAAPRSRAPEPSTGARDFAAARRAFEGGVEQRNRGDDPTEAFRRAVARDPTFGLARLELAEALLRGVNPDYERVGAHVARAVLLLPDNPRAHELFARVAEVRGDREVAVLHYRCALERREGLADARYRLAVQLFELGRFGEAGAELRTLLSADPTQVSARVLHARVLASEDRHRSAAQQLELAARHSGDNPVLLRRAADHYRRAGDRDDAARLDAEADARDPPAEDRELRPLRPSRR